MLHGCLFDQGLTPLKFENKSLVCLFLTDRKCKMRFYFVQRKKYAKIQIHLKSFIFSCIALRTGQVFYTIGTACSMTGFYDENICLAISFLRIFQYIVDN